MTSWNKIAAALLAAWTGAAGADDTALPDAKPVPRMQAIPLPRGAISIRVEGRELTRFHADNTTQRRTFWHPVRSRPEGRSLTRMGHPHDPLGHSHHNSVWITHHDLDGINFWADRGKKLGRIEFRETRRLWDGERSAGAESVQHWRAEESGEILLVETRAWEWIELGEGEGWLLSIAIHAEPPTARDRAVFRQTPFGIIGVRMAKTIGVHDGGGRILNSEGAINEKAVFRKPARWVDYSGPLETDGSPAGITLLDHPENPGHPAPFHVRNDGWMGACLTFGGPLEVTREQPLRLRFGLWIHEGVASREAADAVWKDFSESPPPGAR